MRPYRGLGITVWHTVVNSIRHHGVSGHGYGCSSGSAEASRRGGDHGLRGRRGRRDHRHHRNRSSALSSCRSHVPVERPAQDPGIAGSLPGARPWKIRRPRCVLDGRAQRNSISMVSLLHIFKPFRQIIPDVPAPESRVPFKYVLFWKRVDLDPSPERALVRPCHHRRTDCVFLFSTSYVRAHRCGRCVELTRRGLG